MAPPAADDSSSEDEYMKMTLPEAPQGLETSLQRRWREKKEAEDRAHHKTKAQQEHDARLARETGLNSSLLADTTSKGAKMMAKLGYKEGQALGKHKDGVEVRKEPIAVDMKEDKGGIGHTSEKKRKFMEEVERQEVDKKRKVESEMEFRERVRSEREEKRAEGQWWGAMRICEGLEGKEDDLIESGVDKPLMDVPVEWRTLIKDRREKRSEQEVKRAAFGSLGRSRPSIYGEEEDDDGDGDDGDGDLQSRLKEMDKKAVVEQEVEEDGEGDDVELDKFNSLSMTEKRDRLVGYLREQHNYCFWCKYKYEDKDMEGCPGLTEDEHG
ncbi:MAG: hypothetical protein M1820_008505 [Bogoriella megaspora]|nr:MAG: hypothetical protein M1820_008505 [Bogoriella megaspora]